MSKNYLQPGQAIMLTKMPARIGVTGTCIDVHLQPDTENMVDGENIEIGDVLVNGIVFVVYMEFMTGKLWYEYEVS